VLQLRMPAEIKERVGRKDMSARQEQTLDRFRELIKLLLPTFGNPTTPTVTLCAAFGL